jgi:hypothetical protein
VEVLEESPGYLHLDSKLQVLPGRLSGAVEAAREMRMSFKGAPYYLRWVIEGQEKIGGTTQTAKPEPQRATRADAPYCLRPPASHE